MSLLGRAQCVGFLAYLPAALGVNDDLDAGILGAYLVNVAGEKTLMNRAVALPEQDAAGRQALLRLAALQAPRIPDRHLLQRNSHGISGVAAEVLIGQKEDALTAGKGPFHGGAGAGRGADQPAALAAESLDGGGGVHVGQRYGLVRKTKVRKHFPAGFHLGDFRHIGHGAAGVQVGQNHLLAVAPEHVGALGHKVHAAENNVPGVGFGGDFGELVAVAGEIGEADDFVALVVVAQQQGGGAELSARRGDARIHGVVRERQVVV